MDLHLQEKHNFFENFKIIKVSNLTVKITFLFFCFLNFSGFGQVQKEIVCPVIQDATIYQGAKSTPFGDEKNLVCYPQSYFSHKRRFLVKFDIPVFPAGTKIISAQVQLKLSGISGGSKTKIKRRNTTDQ